MRRVCQYLLLLGGLAGTLSATSILSCSTDGAAYTSSGCYTSPNFYTIESFDWLDAHGTANQPEYNPIISGPWTNTTASNLTVGITFGPGWSGGTDVLQRTDNFYRYYDEGTGTWKTYGSAGSPYRDYMTYQGMFDAPPNDSSAIPGDHLIATSENHPLELQFDRGIDGVMFRVSTATPTTGDLHATISAYAVLNPTNLDIPIATYAVIANGASGNCISLNNGSHVAPVPCNTAPYIGIEGRPSDIRSVVVTTTDNGGLMIGGVYLNDFVVVDGPEPGTFFLLGGALAGIVALARHKNVRS